MLLRLLRRCGDDPIIDVVVLVVACGSMGRLPLYHRFLLLLLLLPLAYSFSTEFDRPLDSRLVAAPIFGCAQREDNEENNCGVAAAAAAVVVVLSLAILDGGVDFSFTFFIKNEMSQPINEFVGVRVCRSDCRNAIITRTLSRIHKNGRRHPFVRNNNLDIPECLFVCLFECLLSAVSVVFRVLGLFSFDTGTDQERLRVVVVVVTCVTVVLIACIISMGVQSLRGLEC